MKLKINKDKLNRINSFIQGVIFLFLGFFNMLLFALWVFLLKNIINISDGAFINVWILFFIIIGFNIFVFFCLYAESIFQTFKEVKNGKQ